MTSKLSDAEFEAEKQKLLGGVMPHMQDFPLNLSTLYDRAVWLYPIRRSSPSRQTGR